MRMEHWHNYIDRGRKVLGENHVYGPLFPSPISHGLSRDWTEVKCVAWRLVVEEDWKKCFISSVTKLFTEVLVRVSSLQHASYKLWVFLVSCAREAGRITVWTRSKNSALAHASLGSERKESKMFRRKTKTTSLPMSCSLFWAYVVKYSLLCVRKLLVNSLYLWSSYFA
jgi:hypothetical protein